MDRIELEALLQTVTDKYRFHLEQEQFHSTEARRREGEIRLLQHQIELLAEREPSD